MKLSVLICTYNRDNLLTKCLDALVYRTIDKPDQVIVVNGGDKRADDVVECIAARAKQEGIRTEIKLIKTLNRNLAASRNVGLPACTGDVIAMTDDDAEVFPDWVTLMKQTHEEHSEAGAIGGPVLGTNTESLVGRVADLITFPSWGKEQYVRTLPGVNISYKREVVERIGAQDETLFRGEDVDYNWRVQRLGYKVFFDLRVKVYHHHRPTLRSLLNQHYMYGRAYYLVRRKWPDLYCVYPRAFRCSKDALKLLNFLAAILYEPIRYAIHMPGVGKRLSAFPLLVAHQVVWRFGMMRQALAVGKT